MDIRKNKLARTRSDVRAINPFRCRMWDLHARSDESIDARSCDSLIESIRKHGQRQPVLGRPVVSSDGVVDIEIIYGARRLFAARHLATDLLVDVREVDDRSALVEMDVENRAREDISPYERGINYSRWLRGGYFRNQAELASEIGVSEAHVSRLLKYAELPTAVLSAFNSVRDIREEWAVNLANACRDPGSRQDISRRAREWSQSSGKGVGSPSEAYEVLLRGARSGIIRRDSRDEVIKSVNGQALFRIAFRAKTLHVILPREQVPMETLQKITRELAAIVEAHVTVAPTRRETRMVSTSRAARRTPLRYVPERSAGAASALDQ